MSSISSSVSKIIVITLEKSVNLKIAVNSSEFGHPHLMGILPDLKHWCLSLLLVAVVVAVLVVLVVEVSHSSGNNDSDSGGGISNTEGASSKS